MSTDMLNQNSIQKKLIKPKEKLDILDLSIILFLLIFIFFSMMGFYSRNTGDVVEIYHENILIAQLPLEKDTTLAVDIDGIIEIVIENKSVFISKNNCKNQICVNSPKISMAGESIICAPKKLIIVIKSLEDEKYYISK